MEFFYRNIRKKHNILMQDQQPLGDKWNYGVGNREMEGGRAGVGLLVSE